MVIFGSIQLDNIVLGMKRDMGGAAAVMMSFWAAVRAGFKQNLHCLLCLAENMIGPEATKPDDIYTLLSGKTVEINNTDAEGRLVLADGVFYGHSILKVSFLLNFSLNLLWVLWKLMFQTYSCMFYLMEYKGNITFYSAPFHTLEFFNSTQSSHHFGIGP